MSAARSRWLLVLGALCCAGLACGTGNSEAPGRGDGTDHRDAGSLAEAHDAAGLVDAMVERRDSPGADRPGDAGEGANDAPVGDVAADVAADTAADHGGDRVGDDAAADSGRPPRDAGAGDALGCDACADAGSGALPGTQTLARLPASEFRGLNWGYNRTQPDLGNYSRGVLRLPLLAATDTPADLVRKTSTVIAAFRAAGANAIRLPVNIQTVDTRWTDYYDHVVSTALHAGFKVILCYWLPATNRLDDLDQVTAMYRALASRYYFDARSQRYPLVFYELANEPAGYPSDGAAYLVDIRSIADALAKDFPGIKKRIIVGGTDYSAYPGPVAHDADLADCYLAVHFYDGWAHDFSTTLKGARNNPQYYADALTYQLRWYQGRVDLTADAWFDRVIVTEFGEWTNREYGYTSQTQMRTAQTITPNTTYSADVEGYRIAYFFGTGSVVNRFRLGSVMWGGLISDGYSLFAIKPGSETLFRNDDSATSKLTELELPLRAVFWGPRATAGTYSLSP